MPPTPDQTLVVAVRGDHELAVARARNWRWTLQQQGAIGATAPGESPRLHWRSVRGDESFQTAHLYIPQAAVDAAREELRRAGRHARAGTLSVLTSRDEVLRGMVQTLLRAMEAGVDELYAQSARAWMIMHLLNRTGSLAEDEVELHFDGVDADRRLARAMASMTERLDRTQSLDVLAGHAGLSKFHFLRLFKRRTGSTPYRFLTRIRMEAAHTLLTTTDIAVGEVARRSGYDHAANFTTAFVRTYGLTPQRLRSQTVR